MLAGDGRCYIVGPADWLELDPLGGIPPYRLSCCTDLSGEGALLVAMDGAGQVWIYGAEGWWSFMEPVPGVPPYDISAFTEVKNESVFIDVIDGTGRVYRVLEEEWYDLEADLDGEAPFSISSYNTDEAAYHFVTDATGAFWMLEDGAVINTIGAVDSGRGPFDMDVYVKPDDDFIAVVLCDSDGVIYNTDGDGWLAQNEGLDIE